MSFHPDFFLRGPFRTLALGLALTVGGPAQALVFITSGDPTFNTTAPGGALTDSGWQFQGQWSGLLGTPVAPNFFLAAKHGGGTVGGAFSYQGSGYLTTAKFDHPTADLTLWQVASAFPTYAPLYTGTDEAGKNLVVFGRSATRGEEVTVSGASPTSLRGWLWNGPGGGTLGRSARGTPAKPSHLSLSLSLCHHPTPPARAPSCPAACARRTAPAARAAQSTAAAAQRGAGT